MIRRQGRYITAPIHAVTYQRGNFVPRVDTIKFPPAVSMVDVHRDPLSDQTVIQYIVEVPRIMRVDYKKLPFNIIEHQVRRDVEDVLGGAHQRTLVKSEEEPQFLCIELSL